MARIVGLSRNLKLAWLDKTVELVLQGHNEDEIKKNLNEYLSFEISSDTNLRKTREILMNIWVYNNIDNIMLKNQALEITRSKDYCNVEIHWCMLLSAYPVFVDICKLIGKISEFQDVITLSQLKQKLYDEWGERTTLQHSIDKQIATLKSFGVLESSKPGKYKINTVTVTDFDSILLMLTTMMRIENKGYYSFPELSASSLFFPFNYEVNKEVILHNDMFSFNNFGGELSVVYNESAGRQSVSHQ